MGKPRKSTSRKSARGKAKKGAAENLPLVPVSLYDKLKAAKSIDVNRDELHGVITVYAYCSYDEYVAILSAVYGGDTFPDCHSALGQTSKGYWKENTYMAVIVVWLNSISEKKSILPVLAHELSHVADFVVDVAGVSDSSGETRAYIIESETRRVFSSMFDTDCRYLVGADEVVDALSKVDCGTIQHTERTNYETNR